jgi:adenylate cyclase
VKLSSTRLITPFWAAVLVGLLVASVALYERAFTGAGTGLLERLERLSLDARVALRGPGPADDRIALVVFDDKTMEQAPHLLQRRAGFAELLRSLTPARVVGVDLFFAEAEEILPPDLAAAIDAHLAPWPRGSEETDAERLLRRVAEETHGDLKLEAALKSLPQSALIFVADPRGQTPDEETRRLLAKKATLGQTDAEVGNLQGAEQIHGSMPRFARAVRALGDASVTEDFTRTVRAVELVRRVGTRNTLSFPLQLLRLSKGVSRGKSAYLGATNEIVLGDERIALDGQGAAFWLNVRGGQGTHATHSAIDVVNEASIRAELKDKIVIVAVSHLGHDMVRTPFGLDLGAAIHANALDNLLHRDFLRRLSPWADAGLSFLLALWVGLIFSSGLRLHPMLRALLGGTAWVFGAGLCVWLFAQQNIWAPMAAPALATGGALMAGLTLAYVKEGRARRQIRQTFAHYLSDDVIEELMAHPEAVAPGGKRRELTVLFSDLRDFTSLSEDMEPEALIEFLNAYLTPMTDAIVSAGGFLDKYIGDAVMGVFGAPLPESTHPVQALNAAIAMGGALEALRQGLGAQGELLRMGIGINTGPMVVGNLGSKNRLDYTVIGDAVNLASRLEGLTKYYGVTCIVGEENQKCAPPAFAFRKLGLVRVKGRQEPVAIFELLAGPQGVLAAYEGLDLFGEALDAFGQGNFEKARTQFEAFAAKNPHDGAAPRYLEKLKQLGSDAPAGWDGVVVHARK